MVIKSSLKDYEVHFETDFSFLEKLIRRPNNLLIIDKNVYELYSRLFANIDHQHLYLLEAVEENKTIEKALEICEIMTDIPAKRNATLTAIGGGITQDLAGFVANILYRGISWDLVPTTLLAGCDSCIGGKTSINYKHFKNLLGTFYPPNNIYICPEFYQTLENRDFESGMGEVIKFNVMRGESGLQYMEGQIPLLLDKDREAVLRSVQNSLEFKKRFIETDEFDRGERIKLNFAHTFGHAIETCTQYQIPHGTAVAIGMIMADEISKNRGGLSESFATRAANLLLQVIHIDINLMELPMESFIAAMKKDKKQTDGALTAVLMENENGELRLVHDIRPDEVADALLCFKKCYLNR